MGATVSKRGLAANDDLPLSSFGETYNGLASQITWQYNWDSTTTSKQTYAEYVPMLWGTASDHTTQWTTNANYWISEGTTHLLSFNEPEQSGQADMTVSEAVTAFRKYMTPFASNASLGAPAVSNDGYSWISEFIDQCTDCEISFIPIHWYNPYTLFDDLQNWVTEICDLGYPVWITEFEANGTDDQQSEFLAQALPWLDDNDCVERYAYFGIADNSDIFLEDGTSTLSALGLQYTFTAFNSTCGELTC